MGSAKVVIDTNVLVAALKSKRGVSHQLLLQLMNGLYTPCVSVPLFVEYESVLKRSGLIRNLRVVEIDTILDYLLSKSSIRAIYYLWRPVLKDPKDDLVLEVAVESGSRYIVTFNKRDFKEAESFGIRVVTPREFLLERGINP